MINVHFVPHTHWDREWYLPFQSFRIRLIRMIDKVLTILEQDSEYASFHLDGQSIVLEDYLEIHPEKRVLLRSHIAAGRIKVGPWYVQPDEALVSGESLIRNFQLGIRIAEEMGGSQRFGYLPDMFGHISQMPQLLAGFGMKEAVFWRGLGHTVKNTRTELRWQGADGTELFAYRFPNGIGYWGIFRLHFDPDAAEQQVRNLLNTHLMPSTQASSVLVTVGVDHMEPQENLSEIIRVLAPRFPGYSLVHSTLERFLSEIRTEAEASGQPHYTAIGEQRDTNRSPDGNLNFLLANVLSSRMPIKQLNTEVQHLLERWAEPFSAILHGLGGTYPDNLLQQSWKYLLQNHPHDSICGCSRDEVHRQMMTRFEWSKEIADQLTDEALRSIAAQVDTSSLPDECLVFHVFNPLEWDRSDTVTTDLLLPDDGSDIRTIEIHDAEGRVLPAQWVAVERQLHAANHPDSEVRDLSLFQDAVSPENKGILIGLEFVRKATVRFSPHVVPALGYATFSARPVRRGASSQSTLVDGHAIENEWLRVEAGDDGSVRLHDKTIGRWYENLLVYEDGGDIGDGYSYSPPLFEERFSTIGLQTSISIAEDGPARGTLRIERGWLLPEDLEPGRKRRSARKKKCRITTEISLGRNDRWVGVVTRFDNQVKDHRLRVKLATGIASDRSWASSAFDTVYRPTAVVQPDIDCWIEDAVGVFPNNGFAGVSSESVPIGFAVAPYGLPEYELTTGGDLYVTLVRSVGYLGSPDVSTIAIGAGPQIETPEGQCQGEMTFRMALIPLEGGPATEGVWRRSAEHHLPVRTVQMRKHSGTLPLAYSFIRIEESMGPIVLSSVKKARGRNGTVIRCFNPTESTVSVTLQISESIKEAYVLDLEENRLQETETAPSNKGLPVTFRPKQIISLEIVRHP